MACTRSIRFAVVIALSSFLFGLPAHASPGRAKTDTILQRLVQGKGLGLDNAGQRRKIDRAELRRYAKSFVIDAESERPTASVRMQLDAGARARLESIGIKTYGNLRGYASAVIPIEQLAEVSEIIGIDRMQLRAIPQLELDASVPATGADMVWNDYNARGQGVIVGVIDSGINPDHPDFINPDGSTRILAIWNQNDSCAGTPPPPPFDFGCFYDQADIQDHIDGVSSIDAPDADGHGTHVSSTAAGNGRATGNGQPANQYVGPANEASIILVKVFPEPGDTCSTCFATDLAIEFIADMAASYGMPYSINMSLGSSYGSHDGYDIDELTIDAVTGPGIPGGVVVKSAGNNRGIGLHESGTVAQGATNSHTFTIPGYSPVAGTFNDIHAFSMWYQGGDTMTVTISDPVSGCPGANSFTCTTGDGFDGVGTTSGVIICDAPGGLAANGDHFMELELDDQLNPSRTPCAGTWTVEVTGDTITEGGHYDFYTWYSALGTSGVSADWDTPDPTQVISIPGTANYTTTVGAYKTKQSWTNVDGDDYSWVDMGLIDDIASFSSGGPTRDGRLKPEITAPGMGIVGALSSDVPASRVGSGGIDRALVQEDGVHWILLGTSFSAPHITGIYAQMLGINPNLDAVQLRTLVTSTASTDGFTEAGSPTPNNDWGYGKVNAAAAVEALIKKIPDLMMSAGGGMWTGIGSATSYNVYRADGAALDGSYFGTCLQSGLATPDFTDAANPALGEFFAYYVTGVAGGVEGLIRIEPDGTGVPPSNPCP